MTAKTLKAASAATIRWACCLTFAASVGFLACWGLAALLDAAGYGDLVMAGFACIITSAVITLAGLGFMLSLTDCDE